MCSERSRFFWRITCEYLWDRVQIKFRFDAPCASGKHTTRTQHHIYNRDRTEQSNEAQAYCRLHACFYIYIVCCEGEVESWIDMLLWESVANALLSSEQNRERGWWIIFKHIWIHWEQSGWETNKQTQIGRVSQGVTSASPCQIWMKSDDFPNSKCIETRLN